MKRVLVLTIFLFTIFNQASSHAAEEVFPRFASLRYSESNIRTGPSTNYPIKWTYTVARMPIQLITKFDNWYKIVDFSGDEGWIHLSLVSSSRYFIVASEAAVMYRNPGKNTNPEYKVKKGVRGALKKCYQNWCEVVIDDKSGWLQKQNLWGIGQYEEF